MKNLNRRWSSSVLPSAPSVKQRCFGKEAWKNSQKSPQNEILINKSMLLSDMMHQNQNTGSAFIARSITIMNLAIIIVIFKCIIIQ